MHTSHLLKATCSALALLVALPAGAQAATYYVSPTGSNSAAGSSAAPWQTLQKAVDTVVAGDTVIVRAGNYAGFNMTRDGTAAARITLSGEPGATVNSRGPAPLSGAMNLEGASYVTIEGFNVTHSTYGATQANIRSVGNTGVIIRTNLIDNTSW